MMLRTDWKDMWKSIFVKKSEIGIRLRFASGSRTVYLHIYDDTSGNSEWHSFSQSCIWDAGVSWNCPSRCTVFLFLFLLHFLIPVT